MSKTFIKYEGCGNDFILFDARDSLHLFSASLIKKLCNRHFDIGADGVLLLIDGWKTPYFMKIYNADGSEPEMCGNGIRCFVKYLVDRLGVKENPVHIETKAGIKTCEYKLDDKGFISEVTVSMGAPIFDRKLIPMKGEGTPFDVKLKINGRHLFVNGVSMGNPHAVIFGDFTMEDAVHLGKMISEHPLFPAKTNVEFVKELSPNEYNCIVYERGCGITLACGTGASAVAAVAFQKLMQGQISEKDYIYIIHLLGGTLSIKVKKDLSDILMTGPAREVFEGKIII